MKKNISISFLLVTAFVVGFFVAGCMGTTPATPNNTTNTNQNANTYTGPCNPKASPFGGGSGTASSPYLVSTFCHLMSIANNQTYWSANFQMTSDIDLTGVTFAPFITLAGVFDGNGHAILNWNAPNALFVFNSGTVKNLTIANVNMVPLGGARPAPLVGTNMPGAVVQNCASSGSINGLVAAILDSDADIYWFVGGLVSINAGRVVHSNSSVAISGHGALGGLVGENNGGTIQTSSASGSVAATPLTSPWIDTNGDGVGGLAGVNTGTISSSFATGTVSGVGEIGGLVGLSSGTVQTSYSTGAVTGTSNVGGLIGQDASGTTDDALWVQLKVTTTGTATKSFWDQTTSGQTASAGGTGEPTASMQQSTIYQTAGWDFTGTWNSPNGGYPTLR